MLLKVLHDRLSQALQAAQAAGNLVLGDHLPEIKLEVPRDTRHGDYATSLALTLAKPARKSPRQIADLLVAELQGDPLFENIEIAGPGFINFRLSWDYLREGLQQIVTADTAFGQQSPVDAHRYLIEFVSANPTGPLHFGHGRWAVLGDCLARLMRTAGYEVATEFYINDTGSQINNLGASVQACYAGLLAKQGVDVHPEMTELWQAYQAEKQAMVAGQVRFYHGPYIQELADALLAQYGSELQDQPLAFFADQAKALILQGQQDELEAFGVHFDEWFPESRLHGEGAIPEALAHLEQAGVTYEQDGALWFRSTDYGDDKDRVLRKKDGSTTYFANDIAYHWNKLRRGYDRLIDLWGADHHGYIARMQASVQALGYSRETLEVLLGQIVHLFRDGEPVRMSKRTGDMVSFGEVFEEVGKDATRYLLMQRSADATLDFDLELAKQQSSDNPVFYVQYAHARICSIFRTAQQSPALAALVAQLETPDWRALAQPEERALALRLLAYPDELAFAAQFREPHRLAVYAEEVAALFHSFYRQCRVLDENQPAQTASRLALARAARIVVRNLLTGIFGISAPEAMYREPEAAQTAVAETL
ncbi:MAG: arginine--tRNA ligase [Candidatus Sericytochromatia bacterium]